MKKWALFLLLASCQTHSQWSVQNIPATTPDHCTRLLYRSEDPIAGIDLEWLQTSNTLTTYLQVHFSSIPLAEGEAQKAEVTLSSPTKTVSFLVDCHQGAQRLRLLPVQQELFLRMLEAGEAVTVSVAGFQETLRPASFAKYRKELADPPYRLPFHLPF